MPQPKQSTTALKATVISLISSIALYQFLSSRKTAVQTAITFNADIVTPPPAEAHPPKQSISWHVAKTGIFGGARALSEPLSNIVAGYADNPAPPKTDPAITWQPNATGF
jgi:hypothetical protein